MLVISLALLFIASLAACTPSKPPTEATTKNVEPTITQEATMTSEKSEVKPHLADLKGQTYQYQIDDYHLQIKFEAENQLHWTYLAAPSGMTGKNSLENIERSDVRPDVILMRWTEKDATQVMDVLDLGQMTMYANFVISGGQRLSSQAQLSLPGQVTTSTVVSPTTPYLVDLKGQSYQYQIDEYHLRITFEEENKLHWEYLAAPGGMTGKNSLETIERSDIRPDVILMRWTEKDGTQVVDVLDLGQMTMYANFVLADGQRFAAQAQLTR